jgi:hypothetical protein
MEGDKPPRDCKQSLRPYQNREAKRLSYNQLLHDPVGEGLAPPDLHLFNFLARGILVVPTRSR